jgi:hypothetical protein
MQTVDFLRNQKCDMLIILKGIKRTTFAKMMEILYIPEAEKLCKSGHKSKLPIEYKLRISPEYLREYRTYFHIAQDCGM